MNRSSSSKGRAKLLDVHLYGTLIGQVREDGHGNPGFTYVEGWQDMPAAVPLSLSMPLLLDHYGKRETNAFLWGLLPENPKVLDDLAREHKVSAKNPISLLAIVGEDCAGAVQFLPAGADIQQDAEGDIEWLTEDDIGQRLARLREQSGTIGRKPGERGRFSLAGAQSKTALHYADGKWGIPSGRIPTTRILKPPMPGLDGQVENEHFCLQLAQRLDFTVSRTEVLTIAGEKAIAVERFDRFPWKLEDGTTEWRRIHQEDMCQALSVMPDRKYQADGGPNIKAILRLLAERSTAPEEDTYAFTRAVGMNFLIAGTDAHAKNFSVLILPGAERSEIRLAPLYDINSALPYYDDLRDVELSLSIDGRKAFGDIMRRHWEAEARASRLYADRVVAELRIMMAALPRVAQETLEACRKDGLGHPMLDLLVQRLTERCRKLEKLYGFRN